MHSQNYNTSANQWTTSDNELDLFELIAGLWQKKLIILISCLVVTAGALAYALLATPIYEVKTIVKPAQLKDLDQLDLPELYSLTPDQGLHQVGIALESYDLRFNFFKENQQLFKGFIQEDKTLEQNFVYFNEQALKMLKPDPKKTSSLSPYIGLGLEYPQGVDGAAIANALLDQAIAMEKEKIKIDLHEIINNRITRINQELTSLRAGYTIKKEAQIAQLTEADQLKKLQLQDELTAIRISLQKNRENRIKHLDEAMTIAASLGIIKPTTPSKLGESEQKIPGSVIKTEISNQEIPLYFMGTEALEAEKNTLLARKNDDFTSNRIVEIQKELTLLEHNRQVEILKNRENEDLFLETLAEKLEQITQLQSLDIDLQRLQLVHVDQRAITPSQAIKPKKKFIVLGGFLVGAMLGIFIALIQNFMAQGFQKKHQV